MLQARFGRVMGASLLPLAILFLSFPAWAVSLIAPDQISADSPLTIELQGVDNPQDFLTIVKPDDPEGRYQDYEYMDINPVQLYAPAEPGDYEIRWLGAESPYPTRMRKALKVVPATARLEAPASAAIATDIQVSWQGPNHPQDFITIVPAGYPERQYATYAYTEEGNPVTLQAPTAPGAYEIRYCTGRRYVTLARAPIQITDSSARVSFQSPARIGQRLQVHWSGPANPREYITVVKAGEPDGRHGPYANLDEGNPLELELPVIPGAYEVRYMTADSKRVLARAPLQIDSVDSSVSGPASAVARSLIQVQWTGPDNHNDYIAISRQNDAHYSTYSYTARGNPVTLEVPREPGQYRIRYLTGQGNRELASAPLEVTPSAEPGKLDVQIEAAADSTAYNTVAVVLDASGSMLQKLEGKRRIDIARQALNQLLGSLKSSNLQFALRVFGHRKADSCDTELLVPPTPSNAAGIAQVIAGLEAKNLARTPIADSLKQLPQDLQGASGRTLVILLTDGEETCGGDPAAEIRRLRASGMDVRVNIVGFAIGEYALKQQFSDWAQAGGGTYFDAQDTGALQKALEQSLQTTYTVLDPQGVAVASGTPGSPALELPAGQYRVQFGQQEKPVRIASGETTILKLP